MKRSEINRAIRWAKEVLERNSLKLPPFAYWATEDWLQNRAALENLRKVMLGWDVTDFGSGDFSHVGGVLFTIRNGCLEDPSYGTPYAEKLIILRHETKQALPLHFHIAKTEDIINRGGGTLGIQLYASTPDGGLDTQSAFKVKMDGIVRQVEPGQIIEVEKGASVTLTPGLYHSFWAKEGAGDLVVGEVSSVNDDKTDNIFLGSANRFTEIEEDEAPQVWLCNEYERFLSA